MNAGTYPIAATDPPRMHLLCLDGGSSTAIQIRMLEYLEQEVPGFLDNTDLIAGSSDGCLIGLCLASRLGKDPAPKVIRDAINFSDEMIDALNVSCAQVVKFVLGLWPLVSARPCQSTNAFTKLVRDRFGDMTLGDLDEENLKVLMLSLSMRRKSPEVFQNFDPHSSDLSIKLADVALASSATPMLLPLPGFQVSRARGQDWFLDGSLIANNPSMTAVVSAAEHLERKASEARRPGRTLGHVKVASLGAHLLEAGHGKSPNYDQVQLSMHWVERLRDQVRFLRPSGDELDWGWLEWLFNRQFDVLDLIAFGWFEDSVDLVDIQCRRLLPSRQYHRYAPGLHQAELMIQLLFGNPRKLREELDREAQKLSQGPGFASLVAWAKEHWMPRAEAQPDSAGEPAPEPARADP